MQEELEVYHEQLAKTYLDHVRDCSAKYQLINEEVEQLKSQLTLSGVSYSEHVSGGSVNKDAIPDGVARLIELIGKCEAQQAEYVDEQGTLHDVLNALDATSARIIKARWIDGMTMEQTADAVNYSLTSTKRLLKMALQEVYEHMPLKYRDKERAI